MPPQPFNAKVEAEKFWHESCIADAMLEFASSEGYEYAMEFPVDKFKEFEKFILLVEEKAREKTLREVLRMPIVFKYGEVSREIESLLTKISR